MFVENVTHGFHFDEELVLDVKVGKIAAENGSVFVVHRNGVLLLHGYAAFPQAVHERILVDLLEMPIPVVAVDGVAGFTNHVTEFEEFHILPFVPSVPLCGKTSGKKFFDAHL